MLILLIFTVYFVKIKLCLEICPEEYSQSIGGETIRWAKTEKPFQIFTSNPPCLDETGTLIRRKCTVDGWLPSSTDHQIPRCFTIINKKGLCPDNFLYRDNHCIFLSDDNTWDRVCKYTVKNHSKISLQNNENVWLPLSRFDNFGPFYYGILGPDYGKPAKINEDFILKNFTGYFEDNCLLFDTKTKTTIMENCKEHHRKICGYHYKFRNFLNCPNNCKATDLDLAKCLCKTINCNNLAVVKSFYEKKVVEQLVGDDLCKVGVGMAADEDVYVNGKGEWIVGNHSTSCCINEEPPLLRSLNEFIVTMSLSFEKKNKKLHLLVYNSSFILDMNYDDNDSEEDENDDNDNDNDDDNDNDNNDNNDDNDNDDDNNDEDEDDDKGTNFAIFCFTSASNQLKKRVKITKIYSSQSFTVFTLKLENYLGEYWCQAFTKNLDLVESNKILAYKKDSTDYSLRIVINNLCFKFNCTYLYTADYDKFIDQKLYKITPSKPEIRVAKIINVDLKSSSLDFIIHLNVKLKEGKNKENKIIDEYNYMLRKINQLPSYMKILYIRNSEYCLPTTSENHLNWPLTNIYTTTTPIELCPGVTRNCRGDYIHGAEWSKPQGSDCNVTSNVTPYFYKYYQKPTTSIEDFKEINQFLSSESVSTLTVSDLYYLSKTLTKHKEINSTTETIEDILDIVDVLINKLNYSKSNPLIKQSTDDLLEILDDITSEQNTTETFLLKSGNLILYVTKPFLTNITGLYLHGSKGSKLTDLNVSTIEMNSTLYFLNEDDFHLGVYVPDDVLTQMENQSDTIIITIFYNDALFIGTNNEVPASHVVSVTIPGFGNWLQTPLSIYYKIPSEGEGSKSCGFWERNRQNMIKGGNKWSTTGGDCTTMNNSMFLCSFVHLTHFALLVMSDNEVLIKDDPNLSDIENSNDVILNMLTILGGTLSFLGILGIFITALLFKNWRLKVGTKILLNLSLAIFLENIFVHLSEINKIKNTNSICKMAGILLHYIVLSKFVWMFIYAILQYIRYVVVFKNLPKYFIIKSMLIGWGVPVLPVLITALLSNNEADYNSQNYEICYPRGTLLYWGVLAPIIAIIIFNLSIFCIVMYNVTRLQNVPGTKANTDHKLQLYLAILLFFILGIPWTFAVLGKLVNNPFIKYILYFVFCITATCQGFVLFLFYVAFNKETKQFWLKNFKFYTSKSSSTLNS